MAKGLDGNPQPTAVTPPKVLIRSADDVPIAVSVLLSPGQVSELPDSLLFLGELFWMEDS